MLARLNIVLLECRKEISAVAVLGFPTSRRHGRNSFSQISHLESLDIPLLELSAFC